MRSDHDGDAEPGQQAAKTTRALTREAWLHRAIEAFRPRFAEIGLPLPAKLHVSVGFGYSSRAESKYILGQCWARRASADGVNHIFLGPQEGDPAGMLVSLLHELIHAADDCASGHKGAFAEAATRLGFDGPMTRTPRRCLAYVYSAPMLGAGQAVQLKELQRAADRHPGNAIVGHQLRLGRQPVTLVQSSGLYGHAQMVGDLPEYCPCRFPDPQLGRQARCSWARPPLSLSTRPDV